MTMRWGVLGTGMIAKVLAQAINESTTSDLAAVGSREQATADAFGDQFNIPKRYASYDALVADPDVDAPD